MTFRLRKLELLDVNLAEKKKSEPVKLQESSQKEMLSASNDDIDSELFQSFTDTRNSRFFDSPLELPITSNLVRFVKNPEHH